jgi:hypothetical protein
MDLLWWSDPIEVVVTDSPTSPWDVAASLATVVALVIAVAALVRTERNRIAAEKATARERRAVFELQILKDLLLIVGGSGSGAPFSAQTGALLAALQPDELPLVRAGQKAFDERTDPREALTQELQRRRQDIDPSDFAATERILVTELTGEVKASMEQRVPPAV